MAQTKELVLSVAIGQAIAERLNLHNDHGLIRTTWGKKTIQGLGEMVLDIVRDEKNRLSDFPEPDYRKLLDECDTIFHVISLSGNHFKLTPQIERAINETWPKIGKALEKPTSKS